MKKTGVFYGSSTGTCEELANQIAEKLGVYSVEPFNVVKKEGNLYTFQAKHKMENAGSFKVSYRMFPKNADLPHRQDFCYVRWFV